MFMARPATAGKNIFERLYLFFTSGQAPTAFDLRRLEREAGELERIGEWSDAYIVRSGLAALQWDLEQAVNWVERALIADPTATVACNASITMRYLNRCDLAVPYALRAAEIAPLDFGIIDHVVAVLAADGRLHEAQAKADEYIARRGAVEEGRDFEFHPGAFVEAMDGLGISEQRLQREIRAGLGILTEEGRRHDGVGFEIVPEPDGGAALSVALTFLGDHEDEMRLEAKFAALLINEPGWDPCRLSVELQHLREHVGEPA
jgi:hypothetical protein